MADQDSITLTRAQIEELRAIIHNADSPLGNRLQDVSSRLYFALDGAGWTPAAEVAQPKGWSVTKTDDGDFLLRHGERGAVICERDKSKLLFEFLADLASSPSSAPAESGWQPKLSVKVHSFPESNGRRNWTALLTREEQWDGLQGNCGGITIERGECWNRVAYEAERTRYLLGLRDTEPFILDYGDDITTPEEWKGEMRAVAPQAVQAGGEGGK